MILVAAALSIFSIKASPTYAQLVPLEDKAEQLTAEVRNEGSEARALYIDDSLLTPTPRAKPDKRPSDDRQDKERDRDSTGKPAPKR
jgi:hypothetical protein